KLIPRQQGSDSGLWTSKTLNSERQDSGLGEE
ncbi:hypothetical protein A2U01_0056258, partial [Trifolium medium]|nr:hypothetical protein [Trifolium medium]